MRRVKGFPTVLEFVRPKGVTNSIGGKVRRSSRRESKGRPHGSNEYPGLVEMRVLIFSKQKTR